MAAVLADAEELVAALGGDSTPSPTSGSGPFGPEERAGWLVGLRRLIDTAEAAFTHTLAEFDAAGDGQVLHAAASTQAWLRGALGMAAGEAGERVHIARAARHELASSVAALADSCSPVSYLHLRTIHRTCRALPPSTRAEAASHLAVLAGQLGVDDLRAAGAHLRHVVDPDGSARHAEEDFGRRWLALSPLLDGMTSIDGILDAETGACLTAALAPFLVPTGPADDRSTEQRRADGLAEIVTTAVRSGQLPTLSGASVAMQVQVPLATLTGGSVEPAQLASAATSAPIWLTAATAARLACDATVHRLILDPAGIPLDLGRQTRTFTPAQRRALAARDRHCRFPGCARPSVYTDAHHLIPWARGGTTNLTNGLLLCRHHHRAVHEGRWTVTADDAAAGANGHLTFTHPDGTPHPTLAPTANPGAGADPPDEHVA